MIYTSYSVCLKNNLKYICDESLNSEVLMFNILKYICSIIIFIIIFVVVFVILNLLISQEQLLLYEALILAFSEPLHHVQNSDN